MPHTTAPRYQFYKPNGPRHERLILKTLTITLINTKSFKSNLEDMLARPRKEKIYLLDLQPIEFQNLKVVQIGYGMERGIRH